MTRTSSQRRRESIQIKNLTHGFASLLLILIILLAFGGLFYYAVSNPDLLKPKTTPETAIEYVDRKLSEENQQVDITNWKVYTNSKVGFSFRYPDRYNDPILPVGPLDPTNYADGTENNAHLVFETPESVSIFFLPTQENLEEFITSGEASGFLSVAWKTRTDVDVNEKGTLKIDDTTGKWMVATHVNGKKEIIAFVREGYGFAIILPEEYDQDEVLAILNTFKFTK